MRPAVLVVVAIAASGSIARAEPVVELRPLAGHDVPAELRQELQIYLAGTARLAVGAPLAATSLQARVREVAGSSAELVTWIEQAPDPTGGGYVVVVVGRRDGRAIVDIGEIPPSDAAGKLLALRIGAFLDETLSSGVGERALGSGPTPPPPRWLAVALGGGRAELPEATASVAVGTRRGAWLAEVGVEGAGTFGSTAGVSPSLELTEQRFGLTVAVGRAAGPFEIRLAGAIDGERVHAVGISRSGDRAEVVHDHAELRAGLDARWWVRRQIGLAVSIGAEHGSSVETIAVEGMPLGHVGAWTTCGTASLVVRFP